LGYEAISLTGAQAGIKTSGHYMKNKIDDINGDVIKGHLNENAPRGSGNKHSSGKGAQLPSKTLWKGKNKI